MSSHAEQQGAFVNRAAEVRRSNERIAENALSLHFVSRLPILCECDDEHCQEFLLLTLTEYRAARRERRYLMAAGHTVADDDATAV